MCISDEIWWTGETTACNTLVCFLLVLGCLGLLNSSFHCNKRNLFKNTTMTMLIPCWNIRSEIKFKLHDIAEKVFHDLIYSSYHSSFSYLVLSFPKRNMYMPRGMRHYARENSYYYSFLELQLYTVVRNCGILYFPKMNAKIYLIIHTLLNVKVDNPPIKM